MLISLKQRWLNFAKRIVIPRGEEIWESLEMLYTEQGRHYHTLEHIQDCLIKLDEWPTKISAENYQSIELAIWFHDLIYDSQRADNEDASAALFTHFFRGHELQPNVYALILATRHKVTDGMQAEEIMCDIDLSILGAIIPGKYQQYSDNIRKEYSWVTDEEYCEARIRVLTNFLAKDHLYQTPYAQGRWGKQARINIQQERDLLSAALESYI
mgnify:CR=1 FL=1